MPVRVISYPVKGGDVLTIGVYKKLVKSGVFAVGEIITAQKVNENVSRIFGDDMAALYDLEKEADDGRDRNSPAPEA